MADVEKGSNVDQGVYRGFLTFTKWGVIFVALVLILMAVFLV